MLAHFIDDPGVELSVRESDGRYRALFDAIDEGFCVVQMIFDDAGKAVDYRFLEINPAFVRQTGFHGAIGKRMRELAPDLEAHWFEAFGRVALTGESRRFQNRAEAMHRFYDVYAFRFGAPEARQVAILFNDITERERAQAERLELELALRQSNSALEQRVRERTAKLRELADELERNNRELQDFTFVVSHDLQEPLRMIHVFGDRLMNRHDAPLDAVGREHVERILSSADRLRRLISDMVLFSRLSASTKLFEKVNLNEVMRDVRSSMEILIERTAARVIVSALPTLEAHPAQMQQLLLNLLGNALKFRRPGIAPLVKISAEESAGQVVLTIADNGIGFDENHGERIFQIFQRLGDRHEHEGSGIGLALCRKIVEQHAGSISVRSSPGVGSTFIVTLPLRQSQFQPGRH